MGTVNIGSVAIGKGAPKVVVPVSGAVQDEIVAYARKACAAGADLIEWRIDTAAFYADARSVTECALALQTTCAPVPLIATLRTEDPRSTISLTSADYENIVVAVIECGAADAVDIELSMDEACVSRLIEKAHAHNLRAITSYHAFAEMPNAAQIRGLYTQMAAEGADICKVACAAQSHADALCLMAATSAFASRPEHPSVVGIAMGHSGAISRVAGEAFGSALTFAALDTESAPGQLSLEQTKGFISKLHEAISTHRFTELRCANLLHENMQHVALLGSPVGHSLSPAIHNCSWSLQCTDVWYVALDCAKEHIGDAISAMKQDPLWIGANVTMPCKQEVIKHLDGIDEASMLIGSVNTIVIRDGKAYGYNTDGLGFVASLRNAGVDIANKKVYVMGGGGAARAVVVQCALEGAASIDVLCRVESSRRTDMESLAASVFEQTGCAMNVLMYRNVDDLAMIVAGADILVNATPVGMGDVSDETPVPAHMFHAGMVVADLVYYPLQTRLLREAAAHGCATVSGLGMLLCQAAESARIWFGQDMDVEAVATGVLV